jgi:universal stress protein A
MSLLALTRILVPTDFSDASTAALKYAVALADAFQARLHLLHVVEDLVERRWATELAMVMSPGLDADARRQSDEALTGLLTREERQAYSATVATELGTPFAAIVKYARREDIDLIVMGTHGRGRIAHLLIGSVAENVVRHAPCPVLTIPLRGHDFVRL